MALAATVLIIVTGAAVRLTGSGLGCPDWPSCYQHRLVAQLSLHPLVEFGNRLVTVGVTVAVAAALIAALARRPRRRDLTWLTAGLVVGVIGQAVIGGVVVYTKLNPVLVAFHFLFSHGIVADAVVLVRRAGHAPGAGTPKVGRELVWLARLVLVVLGVVLAAGTVTTGSGPHAGGPGAARLAIAFRDAAELHSTLVMLLVGLTLATLFALRVGHAPEEAQRWGRLLFSVMVVQGGLGYLQYFTHVPALLVEVHVIGATAVWIAAIGFSLRLFHHPAESPAP